MPNGHPPDAEAVTWGRFSATVDALEDRVGDVEQAAAELVARLRPVEALAGQVQQIRESRATQKGRTWQLVTIVLMGVVMPVLTTVVLVLLHLRK